MRMPSRFPGIWALLLAMSVYAVAGSLDPRPSPVLQAMKDELARSMDTFKAQAVPPYFLSYEITEAQSMSVYGAFGTLTYSGESRRRQLDIDLRAGDYKLDNTHSIRGAMPVMDMDRYLFVELPLTDDPDAIRSVLWYQTDRKYKQAVERLTKVRADVQLRVQEEDKSDDFSREQAERFVSPLLSVKIDLPAWEKKIRAYTAPFRKYGEIYEARAGLTATAETRWFVSSEGSELQTSQTDYRLYISAYTKADDGMELPRYESFFAFSPEGLPAEATVLKTVDTMIKDLLALRQAPVVEPYTGPAILSGRASGVFFHEIFGHRVEGHRQKLADDAQTFKKMVNQKVLPDMFSVHFDPTVARMAETDLSGRYDFDNQGVKARRVTVVENGILKQFLMCRSPIEGFPKSNGHGRKQVGLSPVARQSNLIVQVAQPVSRAELKKMLLARLKEENRPFGLIFEDIQGGFTMTGRMIPNAFNVLPVIVYRIYADGKEELVRGVDLIGTPLSTFSRIVAADDQAGVFNGTCGAESGGVPVAAVSPAVLVSQIEVQKKAKSQDRPPILPPPFEEGK